MSCLFCSGYPVRRPFTDFMFRYGVLGRTLGVSSMGEVEACTAILRHEHIGKDWQMGKTKVQSHAV